MCNRVRTRDRADSERDYRNLGHSGECLSVCARPSQFVVTQAFSIAFIVLVLVLELMRYHNRAVINYICNKIMVSVRV